MSADTFVAPPPEVILDKLGPIVRETVYVEDRAFVLDHPESDRLMNVPAVHEAFARDEYMPYWADIWPASRMMAKAVLHEPWARGAEVLELGCGLGLAGIAALSKGLKVIFSDYDACALKFAADNAKLNGFSEFRTLQLDWRRPPDDLRVPVVLAADLIYEMRILTPLIACIKKVLLPGGLCLVTDVDRVPSSAFKEKLREELLSFTTTMMRAGEPGGRRTKGTLYRITLPA